MKRLKRASLLVAAMATMAIAAPAAAAAADWTDEGEPLTGPTSVSLSGSFGFKVIGSGVSCPIHAEATLEPGGGGEITAFEFEGQYCMGFGVFQPCTEYSDFESVIGPVHATSSGAVEIEYLEFIFAPSGSGCDHTFMAGAFEGLTAVPDDSGAISSLTLAGEGIMDTDYGEANVEAEGAWSLSPAGRYGIS